MAVLPATYFGVTVWPPGCVQPSVLVAHRRSAGTHVWTQDTRIPGSSHDQPTHTFRVRLWASRGSHTSSMWLLQTEPSCRWTVHTCPPLRVQRRAALACVCCCILNKPAVCGPLPQPRDVAGQPSDVASGRHQEMR